MPDSEICNLEDVSVMRDCTILEVAKLMRQHAVCGVRVFEERGGVNILVGIVTEHDLVVEILAPELDCLVITAGDIIDLHSIRCRASEDSRSV